MRRTTHNPVRKYVETRLVEERSKNDCADILDKTIDELYIVLDLIDRKAPLL